MQGDITRFLEPIFELAESRKQQHANFVSQIKSLEKNSLFSPKDLEEKGIKIPNEFSGKEFLGFLLHVNAEIEHGLMIQYLFAAYSLGGEQIPEAYRDLVRKWQEVLLGIAK